MGQKETAVSGKNRIMIFGPKTDGTYVVEFRTAAGEALAISIPRTEASSGPTLPRTHALRAVRAGRSVRKPGAHDYRKAPAATNRGFKEEVYFMLLQYYPKHKSTQTAVQKMQVVVQKKDPVSGMSKLRRSV